MSSLPSPQAAFASRHIGINETDIDKMLDAVGAPSMAALLDSVIPENIRRQSKMTLAPALLEHEALAELKSFAAKNQVKTSLIGMGYYNCHTPPVIQRNILENPAWYTAYTPYQPEISQGRLEAILNFQTMIIDLTGMDIANGSLLDEATAAAEGMALASRMHRPKGNRFIVDPDTHPQTIAILKTRAEPLGIIIDVQPIGDSIPDDCFGGLLSYPGSCGAIHDLSGAIATIHDGGGLACCLRRSFGADPADTTGRNGCRYCRWQCTKIWRAIRLWRAACRLFCVQPSLAKVNPRTVGRGVARFQWPPCLPAGTANP
jgi:glycine dehydrogenase